MGDLNYADFEKIEKAGWKVGSADEFLGLTKEESAYIEMKLATDAAATVKEKLSDK